MNGGDNATTAGDIVKCSGSSKRSFYYHFKTKENLFGNFKGHKLGTSIVMGGA